MEMLLIVYTYLANPLNISPLNTYNLFQASVFTLANASPILCMTMHAYSRC